MKRYLRTFIGAGLALLLGAMLFTTIYFTLFDLQWIAFLAGVLFAAVAALASQASKAQWLILRRTRQLQRVKDLLAQESLKLKYATQALKHADERFQFINDKLPVMIVFIDREERCHYHNHAFAQWCKHASGQISGQLLRDVVGDEAYRELKSNADDVLAGREIRYEAGLEQPDGGIANCTITLLPFPAGPELPEGFYALVARGAGNGAAAPALHPRAELVRALQEDDFILFAQTIRALAPTPYPQLVEVLLRLQDEEQSMAPPGGFFPVAERYNLMPEIDRWVVRNLLKWTGEKRHSDPAWPMPLYCVNLAGASLRDPEFALYVRRELQSQKFPGKNLCFEITEPDVLNQNAAVQAFMTAMRPLGCRFTLDNFGSTQVSFAPLNGLTLDFLKIDGAIIQNILTHPDDFARVREIVAAAHKIGMRTIAGFVESDATIEKLREIGVDYAQGFGISKPGPIA
jgi:EAL domain-containing protein (putative c-di-GMP-specific phosphodiesterase class I)/PAS domain-containing protein